MLTPPIIDWDVVEMLNVPIGRRKLGITDLGGFIPYGHSDILGPFTTVSAVMVDITNATVTLTLDVKSVILYWFSADLDGTGGGSLTRIAYTVSTDGVDHPEHYLDFSASDTFETGAFNHVTGILSPGAHVLKGRMRRVSGTQTAQATNITITAIALPVP